MKGVHHLKHNIDKLNLSSGQRTKKQKNSLKRINTNKNPL